MESILCYEGREGKPANLARVTGPQYQEVLPKMKNLLKYDNKKNTKKSNQGWGQPFDDYKGIFVPPVPRWIIKYKNGTWFTQKRWLSDWHIANHLAGIFWIGVLGKWYPVYAILDFDSRSRSEVDEIRKMLGFNELNSMLCESESKDSYHLLFSPEYHGRPPTLNLLNIVFKNPCTAKNVEIYPQRNRGFRLPFGSQQNAIDPGCASLRSWQDNLSWFEGREKFDLSTVSGHQMVLDLEPIDRAPIELPEIGEAPELFSNGLQAYSTRHHSQYQLIHYFFRQNVHRDHVEKIVWNWIRRKNNGFSKDIINDPALVKRDIANQTTWLYNKYQLSQVYPDSTHNLYHGYVSKMDIPLIVEACAGSLPRMRFLYNLVKHFYPRRHMAMVRVHRDKFIEWGSHNNYLKYLAELETKGIVERGRVYSMRQFSKSLKLNWEFRSNNDAALHDGRSVNGFESTIRSLFEPADLRSMLQKAGVAKQTTSEMIKRIFGESKKPKKVQKRVHYKDN